MERVGKIFDRSIFLLVIRDRIGYIGLVRRPYRVGEGHFKDAGNHHVRRTEHRRQ